MRRRILIITLVLALVAVGVTGCKQQSKVTPQPKPAQTTETPTPTEPTATVDVKVYFIRGEKIGVAGRAVAASDKPATLAFEAMQALVEGPNAQDKEFGLGTVIPEGTTVNAVKIENGTATVDLSKTFESGGGSLSMLLRVTQVICTLTQFDGVKDVAFELDGKPVEAIGGEGVIVSPPVGRADFEGQLPAILVETPVPGQEVASPLIISGSSNVFEAVHQVNVTDPDGLILVDKTVNATSGTGTRGTWSITVEFGPVKFDGLGAVIVFDRSAKDGSRKDIVEIPVRMTK